MQQGSTHRFPLVLLKAAAVAFLIEAIGEGLWGVFLALNLRSTPTVPLAIVPEVLVLYLLWRYSGGWGPPTRTAAVRRIYRRANPVATGRFLKTGAARAHLLRGARRLVDRAVPPDPHPSQSIARLFGTSVIDHVTCVAHGDDRGSDHRRDRISRVLPAVDDLSEF